MRSLIRGAAWLLWAAASLWMVGWYVEWLSRWLWRPVAVTLSIPTCPLIPLAVVIEWLTRGWPHDATVGFVLLVVAWCGALVPSER